MTLVYTKFGPCECGASLGICAVLNPTPEKGTANICRNNARHWYRTNNLGLPVGLCDVHREWARLLRCQFLGTSEVLPRLPLDFDGEIPIADIVSCPAYYLLALRNGAKIAAPLYYNQFYHPFDEANPLKHCGANGWTYASYGESLEDADDAFGRTIPKEIYDCLAGGAERGCTRYYPDGDDAAKAELQRAVLRWCEEKCKEEAT